MRWLTLKWLAVICWVWGLTPIVHADEQMVFQLRNGDRLTGTILTEDERGVTISSPALGKIVIPVAEIERRDRRVAQETTPAAGAPESAPLSPLTASQQRRLSELTARYLEDRITPAEYHRQRARILSEPEAPPSAASHGPPAPAAQSPAQSAAATPVQRAPLATTAGRDAPGDGAGAAGFFERLRKNVRGNFQAGMDLGFGTKEYQLYTGRLQLNHAEKRLRNALDYRVSYGHTDDVLTANEMEGSLKTDFDLGKRRRIYAYNTAGAGFNEVRKIDLTYHEGLGLGYKLLTRSNLLANLEAGAQYQAYEYANRPSKEIVSVRFGQEAAWRITPKLMLTQKAQVTPSVEDLADYRLRFDARLSYPLFKNLTLSLNVIDQYDSQPAPGVEPNDLQVQSTVGFSF